MGHRRQMSHLQYPPQLLLNIAPQLRLAISVEQKMEYFEGAFFCHTAPETLQSTKQVKLPLRSGNISTDPINSFIVHGSGAVFPCEYEGIIIANLLCRQFIRYGYWLTQ